MSWCMHCHFLYFHNLSVAAHCSDGLVSANWQRFVGQLFVGLTKSFVVAVFVADN